MNVEDKSAELWIKVLSLVAVVTLPLIGVIGSSLIDGQKKMTEELSSLNAYLQTHEVRISRNEKEIEYVKQISSKNSSRLYNLEGAKHE